MPNRRCTVTGRRSPIDLADKPALSQLIEAIDLEELTAATGIRLSSNPVRSRRCASASPAPVQDRSTATAASVPAQSAAEQGPCAAQEPTRGRTAGSSGRRGR